jgi:hypothetical protein
MRWTPLLPPVLDNAYRGHRAGLWLFALVLLVRTGIALGTTFNGREAAQSADGIPLDSFGAGGAQTVVALFAIWGLAHLVLGALGIVALVRYRAMVPVLFLVEHVARRWSLMVHAIPRTGAAPGGMINRVLLAVTLVGLVLSLWRRGEGPG